MPKCLIMSTSSCEIWRSKSMIEVAPFSAALVHWCSMAASEMVLWFRASSRSCSAVFMMLKISPPISQGAVWFSWRWLLILQLLCCLINTEGRWYLCSQLRKLGRQWCRLWLFLLHFCTACCNVLLKRCRFFRFLRSFLKLSWCVCFCVCELLYCNIKPNINTKISFNTF